MAKKRKKKHYRLRKSVRRTLGALFMITAIIIAAIPFPDAAATDGSTENTPGEEGDSNSSDENRIWSISAAHTVHVSAGRFLLAGHGVQSTGAAAA